MNGMSTRGFALVLVLWALFVITLVVFALVRQLDQQVFLDTRDARAQQARSLAFSGLQVALHPAITDNQPPGLRGGRDATHRYAAELRGEGGKLNLNWLVLGEDPRKLQVLRNYLELRGLNYTERDQFIDGLLDWTDADNLSRLNGSETDTDGRPVPNRPLNDLSELRRMHGAAPLLALPDWDRDLTLLTNTNPTIDLRWADVPVLAALPGVGEVRARAFVELRRGRDGLDGTADDPPMADLAAAMGMLGLNPADTAGVSGLIGLNSPVYRIRSVGEAVGVSRSIEAVVIKSAGGEPQILLWQERQGTNGVARTGGPR